MLEKLKNYNYSKVSFWGLFGLIFFFFCIPLFVQELVYPTVSDHSLTKGLIGDYIERGTIDGTYSKLKSWYTYPKIYEEGLTIQYPQLMYLIGVIGVILLGQVAYIVLPMIFIFLTLLYLYKISELLASWFFEEKESKKIEIVLAWLFSVGIISKSWVYSFRFELIFTVLVVVSLYYVLLFYRQKYFIHSLIVVILLSLAASLRQNYLIYAGSIIFLVIVQTFLFSSFQKAFQRVLFLIFTSLIIIGGFYLHFIGFSGTVSYYSQAGYPVIDDILSPGYLEFDGLDQELNTLVDTNSIFSRAYSGFENQYGSLRKLFGSERSVLDIYRNLNSNLYMNVMGFCVMVVLTIFVWNALDKKILSLYVSILLPYLAVFVVYTSNPRYLQMHYFLGVLSVIALTYIVVPYINRYVSWGVMGIAILIIMQGVWGMHSKDVLAMTTTFWGKPADGYVNAVDPVMNWIEFNTSSEDRIFSIWQREISLHTGRDTIWDPRIWFIDEKEDLLKYWEELYKSRYIVIKKSDIKKIVEYRGPGDVLKNSTMYELILNKDYFAPVYEYQDITIYEYVGN